MSRRHHHHLQPYDFDRFSEHPRDKERDQTRGIEYQDDSLSSINSEDESYLHHQHSRKENKSSNFYTKPESTKPNKPDKPANNEPYHMKETKMQTQQHAPPVPDPTSERLGRLESMLEQLIKQNKAPPEIPAASTKIPEKGINERRGQFSLEPRRHDFTTSMWINKIQEISMQNNWDEATTISYMGSKMSGIIKAWYNSLPNYDYTWPEWKILISKVFPDNTDFVTMLKRLVTRLKQADESMATYYFSKMYLIEGCKITGEDAVSCLIDGLNNQSIQEQAKTQNYLTPETLYSQFLMILPQYTVDYAPKSETVLSNWYYEEQEPNIGENPAIAVPEEEEVFEYEQDPRNEEFDYRNHEEDPRSIQHPSKNTVPVHSRLDKRFLKPTNFRQQNKIPMAAKVCTVCHKRGHLARQCRKSKLKYCKLTSKETHSCYFKKCTINHHQFKAFIDTGCTTVTIRQKEAHLLDLNITPSCDTIEAYGGQIIPVLGEVEVRLCLESVQAPVRAVIVPDRVQDVPVVVGQEFLNKKNVCVLMQNGTLKIFEASNKLTD